MTNIPGFRTRIDLSFDYWLAIWTVCSALAFVAAARGSGQWAWAGLLSPSLSLRSGGDSQEATRAQAKRPEHRDSHPLREIDSIERPAATCSDLSRSPRVYPTWSNRQNWRLDHTASSLSFLFRFGAPRAITSVAGSLPKPVIRPGTGGSQSRR